MRAIFAEGYKARQGGYQGSDAADINSDQKIRIVARELREQYRGGHIAYELAGYHADKQSVVFK